MAVNKGWQCVLSRVFIGIMFVRVPTQGMSWRKVNETECYQRNQVHLTQADHFAEEQIEEYKLAKSV